MILTLNNSTENIKELKIKLRKKYPQLTEADLSSPENNINDILRMIEYKLRKSKKEMLQIIAKL